MQLSKNESIRIMQMWNDYGVYLEEVFARMIKDNEASLTSFGEEWFVARQLTDYLARKQALIDLKKILSQRYE